MTDTLAVGTITQLTETGHITISPLTRYEVDMAQFATAEAVPAPDPRDAEIADLQRWLEIKQTTADGLGKLALEYQQQVLGAQARIAELEAIIDGYKNLVRVANVVVGKKDMRIAELEAALREVYRLAYLDTDWPDDELLSNAGRVAGIALGTIPAPERDMAPTREELDA